MIESSWIIALAVLLSAAVGGLLAYAIKQRQIHQLREQNSALAATLETERQHSKEKIETLEQAREQLSQTFAALSNQALKSNTEEFLKLAQENLKQMHIKAQSELSQKEKSIENMIKPIKDALEKAERQINEMEQARKEAYGSLHKHLETMTQTQQMLHNETRNLVQALRRPEVRGRWGEMTLKRLVELAGMVEHCDFYSQETARGEEGSLRPDMIIRMPDQREIVVDVKTPLDAYLSAIECADDQERDAYLQRHARFVRERVRELSSKSYWSQFQHSPDFVVMFIPGDQFLNAALDIDRDLLEEALRQKVILATPTSFVALLRAVGYGWRQQALADNAEKIRVVGEDLYKRLATFTEHLSKVGRHLGMSLDSYNKAVGSFERQVMPGARRFTEMGIHTNKTLEEPGPIEKAPRRLDQQSDDEGDDAA